MADLIAKTPAQGLLPVTHGALILSEASPGTLTSLMPFKGQAGALSAALQAAHGLSFPAAGQQVRAREAACLWTGLGQAFLAGPAPAPELAQHAAMTDQSDAWVVLELTGKSAADALARLVPVDLRPQSFGETQVARTLCQHANIVLYRIEGGFGLMGFRSMAATLVHEIADAMANIAARQAAG